MTIAQRVRVAELLLIARLAEERRSKEKKPCPKS